MADERWHIEGEFRDGSMRVRDSNGQYKSVSSEILEEVSEFETFSESDLASRLGVDETVVLEHLGHLESEGLISGNSGNWSKEPDAIEDEFSAESEHQFPWEGRNSDDESIY